MKKILHKSLMILIVISAVLGNSRLVYADYSKIDWHLYDTLNSMTDEDSKDVQIFFDKTLDIVEIEECTKDLKTYEERCTAILSMYTKDDKSVANFIQKYYENDKDKINSVNYDLLTIDVEATKSQILQFSEEESICYITAEGYMTGMDEVVPSSMITLKASAMANIIGYVDISAYRMEQQEEVQAIIRETLEDINFANDAMTVRRIVIDSEKRIDAVKTDEQLKQEEQPIITPPDKNKEPIETPPQPEVPPQTEPSQPVTPPQTGVEQPVNPPQTEPSQPVTPPQVEHEPTVSPSTPEVKSSADSSQTESESATVSKESTTVSNDMKQKNSFDKHISKSDVSSEESIDNGKNTEQNTQDEKETGRMFAENGKTVEAKKEANKSLETVVMIIIAAIVIMVIWFWVRKKKKQ